MSDTIGNIPDSAEGEAKISSYGAVARLWNEVLGSEDEPEPNEDFVAAGGDSLQLVKLLSLIRRELHCRLDLAEVLSRPTVANIASLVESAETSE